MLCPRAMEKVFKMAGWRDNPAHHRKNRVEVKFYHSLEVKNYFFAEQLIIHWIPKRSRNDP